MSCVCAGVIEYFIYQYFKFFCCKQKTAYEVRISDWSSDVCSSDLAIKCNAPSTAGSVTNIVSLHKGEYDFGFIQSDHQHKALQGLAPFDKEGAVELRAVFSLQSEIPTVVVRNDSGITNLAGLEGKGVNIGGKNGNAS